MLGVAIAAVSAAGTLVRLADAHPLLVAFWRTAAVALLLTPWTRRAPPRQILIVFGAGLCLALHFWAWFASLGLTTVLRSTVLVCLTPIWTGLGEWAFFGRRPRHRFWVGIAVALGGLFWMGRPEAGGSPTGDALALLGGLLSASYLLIGSGVRRTLDLATYGAWVCGAAALVLAVLAMGLGVSLRVPDLRLAAVLAALALGPQLLGHIGFAWALGRLPAATVAAVILLEPVGATGVAALVLGEAPSAREIGGGLGILVGVMTAVWPSRA